MQILKIAAFVLNAYFGMNCRYSSSAVKMYMKTQERRICFKKIRRVLRLNIFKVKYCFVRQENTVNHPPLLRKPHDDVVTRVL